MMKLLGIGDSIVDYYQDQGFIYPGGSSLNVSVLAKRNGADAGFIGMLGTDKAGNHIVRCLVEEKVDIRRLRRVEGPTGEAVISLNNDGDRIFVSTNKDRRVQSLVTLSLNGDDLEYIDQYDVIHTCASLNTGLEREIPKLAGKAISFDFSTPDFWSKEYLSMIAPYLTYAFFSGSEFSLSEIRDLCDFVHKLGVRVIGVTRGAQPAIFSENGVFYEQVPILTEVVDTMGAGDSFIASFLVNYHISADITDSIHKATKYSSSVCGYYGAIGYPLDK